LHFFKREKAQKVFKIWGQLSSSFQQLVSWLALRAIPQFPHRPEVVAVISGNRV